MANVQKTYKVEISGPAACFTRPEFKVERFSYDCPTPSAAVGMLAAIYSRRRMRYRIVRIYICNPIAYLQPEKRNEVKSGVSLSAAADAFRRGEPGRLIPSADNIMQRSTVALRDVRYVIEFVIEPSGPDVTPAEMNKYRQEMEDRMASHGCRCQLCLGCSDYPASYALCSDTDVPSCPPENRGEHDLGLMFYGWSVRTADTGEVVREQRWFHAVMIDGVVQVPPPWSCEVLDSRPACRDNGYKDYMLRKTTGVTVLESLYRRHERQLAAGEIPPPGMAETNVDYAFDISRTGKLSLRPLREKDENGRLVPVRFAALPAAVQRGKDIKANTYWDNGQYFFGIPAKNGSREAARDRWCAFKKHHEEILKDVHNAAADAIRKFLGYWKPDYAEEFFEQQGIVDSDPGIRRYVMCYNGLPVTADKEVLNAYLSYDRSLSEDANMGICLVTGEYTHLARIVPSVHMRGAQATGASLISFNTPSVSSFGLTQGENAPIGMYAAAAVMDSLNSLLRSENHCMYLGETAVLYWADENDEEVSECVGTYINGSPENSTHRYTVGELTDKCRELLSGKRAEYNGKYLAPGTHFYILGLNPNAGRISVAFFLQDTLENIARHVTEHYDRLRINCALAKNSKPPHPFKVLAEIIEPDLPGRKFDSQLTVAYFRSVLTGTPYPWVLTSRIIQCIETDGMMTRTRAEMLKAYYLQQNSGDIPQGVLAESLDVNLAYPPYVFGRILSICESIHQIALSGPVGEKKPKQKRKSKSSKKERKPNISGSVERRTCLNGFQETPGSTLEGLMRRAFLDLDKMDVSSRIYWENLLNSVCSLVPVPSPAQNGRLLLPPMRTASETAAFVLGYVHQTEYRYMTKEMKESVRSQQAQGASGIASSADSAQLKGGI